MCVLFVTWKKVSEEELKEQNFASLCILHIVVLSLYTDQTISLQYCNIIGSHSSLSIGQFQRQKNQWLMRIKSTSQQFCLRTPTINFLLVQKSSKTQGKKVLYPQEKIVIWW